MHTFVVRLMCRTNVYRRCIRMSTVTFRVTDDEKSFIQSMADLNGLSLSELARTKLLESLENQIDMVLYDKAMKAHQLNDESVSHHDMLKELGL